jgi:hypothetical protein
MILDYLWRYPRYIILLIMVDLVSVSYPPVFLIPRSMVAEFIKLGDWGTVCCTVGFARNRDIVALVQKKTYVECTEYVRRHTPATASSRQPQTTNKRTMAISSEF